jgi:dihydroxyacetone kinase-like protein
MKRGFEAVAPRAIAALSLKPLAEALKGAGMTLVMKVGGASGPLYGTLVHDLGKRIACRADWR